MKKGFTLIELLVVIAIIALLLSIVLPSLKTAKEMAGASVCLARESQLLKAWLAYAQENKDVLIIPDTKIETDGSMVYKSWVDGPQDISGTPMPYKEHTLEDEIRGIRKGSLYPYYQDEKLVHCPSDKRHLKPPTNRTFISSAGIGGYRTYSFVAHAGTSQFYVDRYWSQMISRGWALKEGEYCTKFSDIKSPGSKYVLVEENDNRGLNSGSWCILLSPHGLVDPFAVFHNMRSILGFADGHAEKVVWQDKRTEKYSDEINGGRDKFGTMTLEHDNNPDMEWLFSHYPRK